MPQIARFFMVPAAFLIALSSSVIAVETKPVEAQPSVGSFFNDPDIRSVVLSPKGNYVAMLVKGKNQRYLLAVLDAADPTKSRVVAQLDAWDIVEVHWINENRLVFTRRDLTDPLIHFAHSKKDHYFDDNHGNRDQFAINRDGSESIPLIAGSHEYRQHATGSNIKSKMLEAIYSYVGSMDDDSDDIIVKRSNYTIVDRFFPESTHLFRLNTKSLELTDLIQGTQPKYATQWILDANHVPRIASSRHDGRCTTSYLAPGEDKWKTIGDFECLSNEGFKPYFMDAQNGLYVSAPYKGYAALFKYDLQSQKMAPEPLLSMEGFDYAGGRIFDYEKKKVLGVHTDTDAHSIYWFDPTLKEIQKNVDQHLPNTSNILSCGIQCLSSPVVLVAATSDRQPTKYLIYNVKNNSMVGLGSSYAEIEPKQMGVRQFFHFAARDGRQIPVYVTLPPGKPTGPQPTVVYLHGGPNARGFSWEWDAEAQFLASRGYVVIQPEFRGSLGYGYDHYHAGWKQFGQAMQDDVADATKWAIQQGWSDSKRIAVLGMSYGGYSTLMGLIKNPELYRCGVQWSGITDLTARYTSAQDDATEEVLHYILPATMGDPDADANMLKEFSPVNHASEIKQPLLMAHGAEDVRIPIDSATRFYDAVSKTNSNVQWKVYADERHGIALQTNRIDFWTRVEAFLDTNLKTLN